MIRAHGHVRVASYAVLVTLGIVWPFRMSVLPYPDGCATQALSSGRSPADVMLYVELLRYDGYGVTSPSPDAWRVKDTSRSFWQLCEMVFPLAVISMSPRSVLPAAGNAASKIMPNVLPTELFPEMVTLLVPATFGAPMPTAPTRIPVPTGFDRWARTSLFMTVAETREVDGMTANEIKELEPPQ